MELSSINSFRVGARPCLESPTQELKMITSTLKLALASAEKADSDEPLRIPVCIEHSRGRAELVSNPEEVASLLLSLEASKGSKARGPSFEAPSTTLSEDWLWKPVTRALAWSAVAEILQRGSEGDKAPMQLGEASTEFRERPTTRKCIEATEKFCLLLECIRPLWQWHRPPGNQSAPERSVPPTELLPSAVEAAIGVDDPLVRGIALAIILAAGQEVFLRHRVSGDGKDGDWYQVGKAWVDYLSRHHARETDIQFRLQGRDSVEYFRSTWLPASTIRTVGVRLGMGGNRKKDFVARLGYWHPWRSKKGVIWLAPSLRCDAVPTFTTNSVPAIIRWWLPPLRRSAGLLLAEAAAAWQQRPFPEYPTLCLPWHRQALTATVAVSAALRIFDFRTAINKAAKLREARGEFPNYLSVTASACLEGRKTGEPPLPTDRFPFFIPVDEERTNIARDLRDALKGMPEYESIVAMETALLDWWHPLFFPMYYDATQWHGTAEAWLAAVGADRESPSYRDVPPTTRISGAWLKSVMAFYARCRKWPPHMSVPGKAELLKVFPDFRYAEYNRQVEVTDRGKDDDFQVAGDGMKGMDKNPLVRLTLAGWFLKGEERILDYLGLRRPGEHPSGQWGWPSIGAAIAAAAFIHGPDERLKARGKLGVKENLCEALSCRMREAAGQAEEDEGVNIADWLERFLDYDKPFPVRL